MSVVDELIVKSVQKRVAQGLSWDAAIISTAEALDMEERRIREAWQKHDSNSRRKP